MHIKEPGQPVFDRPMESVTSIAAVCFLGVIVPPKIAMTRDEQETWQERVSIMLAELNPAGMSDAEVDAAHAKIEAVATEQIEAARRMVIEQRKNKKQSTMKWGK